ncbi:MAG TPA: ribonuclease HII [Syntrophales bacterium]|nr:ribonuclease HII [Syntrophales bacterium]HOM07254.1 ribonuclease HII [Syntrophales bacterium]HON99734.1 ribonuclease HII [Syntrophales bacterium]HPC01261.1 ribonuclease HII [Syntrophales bacterium]HPQ06917.1 ribonuclease HII [Syntrophales bacterium]
MREYERQARLKGYTCIAGVDEAGRGPLAGPVVAAAVILPEDYRNPNIKDSKELTSRKREQLYEVIVAEAVSVGLGVVEVPVIDTVNILQATLLAMKEAVADLDREPDFLLVDGNRPIPLLTEQETVVGGDKRCLSIAAASIIAKVSRDRIMDIYHRQFPQYNFKKNKGYGTLEHREAIRRYGPCKIHRRSFRMKDGGFGLGDLFS